MNDHRTTRIERLPAVLQRTGLSRSSVYAGMAAGTFPESVRLATRARGWIVSEVDEWIAARAAERRSQKGAA